MRSTTCSRCGGEFPRSGAYAFRGAEYCAPCADTLRSDPEASDEEFLALSDPTTCAFCGADGGEAEFPRQMGLPACPACERRLYRAPLPTWVKAFLAAIALVLVACTLLNLPYYRSFALSKSSVAALKRGDLALAAARMGAASAALPKDVDTASTAALLGAWASVSAGDMAAAEGRYEAYLAAVPNDAGIRREYRRVQASLAFDKKEWREFYRHSAAASEGDESPMGLLARASAAASLWAAYGEADRKAEAEGLIARALAGLSAGLSEGDRAQAEALARRTRYRIDTREILEPDEYYRRHPEEKQP
jgi:hypothetical protein